MSKTHRRDLGELDTARAALLGDNFVRDLVLEDTGSADGKAGKGVSFVVSKSEGREEPYFLSVRKMWVVLRSSASTIFLLMFS